MVFKEKVAASVLDFDEKVLIRPLAHYGWMLSSAARHSVPLRLTGPDMQTEGLTWIITHFSVEWFSFPDWTQILTVETWPQERKGFRTRRDYRITTAAGNPVASGASHWCLLDLTTRKPVPMDRIADRLVQCHPEEALPDWKGERLVATDPQKGVRDEPGHRVSYGDLDFNDHCTNIRYVEWAWNALDTGFQKARRPVRLDVQFLSEAFAGDILVVETMTEEDLTCQSLKSPDGSTEYCRVKTSWRLRTEGE